MLCFLTDTCHKYDGYKESESSCESVYNTCQQSVSASTFVSATPRTAQFVVDQRKVDSEGIVK